MEKDNEEEETKGDVFDPTGDELQTVLLEGEQSTNKRGKVKQDVWIF